MVVETQDVEVTVERVLAVWWAFVWRSAVFSMLIGVFMGATGGFIVGAAGHPELGAPVGALLGWLAGIPVSIFVLRKVLVMRFSGFSVKLVASPTL